MDRRESEASLAGILEQLGDQEIEAILWIATRLLHGQKRYGTLDLERDRRDFRHERAEELADALTYSAMDEIQRALQRKALARGAPAVNVAPPGGRR